MSFCQQRSCGCTIVSSRLSITGSGTAADPWDIEPLTVAEIPLGGIIGFGGDTVSDPRWLLCRGAAVSRVTYAALFALVGTRWGVGDGSTTFNVPNYQGTYPVGYNTGVNTPTNATGIWTAGVGERSGSKDLVVVSHNHFMSNHTHTTTDHLHGLGGTTGNENQSHNHSTGDGNQFLTYGVGLGATGPGSSANLVSVTGGENQAHNHNLPATTGAADRSLGTSGPSTNLTSTDGFSGVNANLPPSLSGNFIIRALP